MKGNLARREPEIQEHWKNSGLYGRILAKGEGRPLFVLHDGPPYANGEIHVGTAYNKILKDIIIKYRTMRGYLCPYVPGWDCHGQPIEHEVTKRLGGRRIDKMALRAECREYAMRFVGRQAEQFERLGVLGDFEHPYLTLDPKYEAANVAVFAELYRRGLVFRGRKPIHWCTSCVTALAEAEIEYEDKKSSSVFVRFPLAEEFPPLTQAGKRASLLIWTTTPWTLPANVAVALHPRYRYVGMDTGDEILVVAADLSDMVAREAGISGYEVIDSFEGKELEGLTCEHPWAERRSVIVLADYVTLEQGTGCVHIAPGHGQEDYLTGLEYDLPSPMPVDDNGYFDDGAGPFAGLSLDEANPLIIEDLRLRGLLLASGEITHQYPHCWRCKQPVVFRATPQWFIALDRVMVDGGESSLRDASMHAVRDVEWIPDWTVNRIASMVSTRPDWCISRQRSWGVPIPILYCAGCGRELATPSSFEAARVLIEAGGADAWFSTPPDRFLPAGTACEGCGGTEFEKESDIVDVWFESGVSHLAVLRERPGLSWPADLYVEGSDQHRGWFQSSLLLSVGTEDGPPYRAVLTHGFTVDGEGKKMSKSLGNAVDPREVYSRSGADILRLWTASTDYSSDMPVSDQILSRVTESYRRIRNTMRFLLGNSFDFDSARDAVPVNEMEEIDRWMVSRLQGLVKRVTSLMDRYLLHQAIQALHLFCTVDLSSLYLDILKDRLYTFPAESWERRSAQTALVEIFECVTAMVAPVLSHTAEEAWLSLTPESRSAPSVHLIDWPEPDEALVDEELEEKWRRLLEVRELVYQKLEEARQQEMIGTGLEARVSLTAQGEALALLRGSEQMLPMLFIVSQVDVAEAAGGNEGSEVGVTIELAEGDKCQRCWNFNTTVGADPGRAGICARCAGALEAMGR